MRRSLIVAVASGSLGLLNFLPHPVAAQGAGDKPIVTPVSTPVPPVEKTGEPVAAEKPVTPAPTPVTATPSEPTSPPAPVATQEPAKPEVTAEPAPVAPKPEAPQVAAPATPQGFTLNMAEALPKLGPKSGADKRDVDALTAFYKARNGAPLWFTEKGRTPEGDALAAEIARAGDYGLDPSLLDAAALKAAPAAGSNPDDVAIAEARLSQAVLKYARHARGGRFEPTSLTKFLDRQPRLYEPASVIEQIAVAKSPAAYLRQLHPQHAQFERLRQKYLSMRKSSGDAVSLPPIPDGPKIAPGASHPHVALVRARLGIAKQDGASNESVLDDALAAALKEFQTVKGLKPADGSIGNGTRRALNGVVEGNPKKILANMEQWRWMPDQLGDFYVWVNVPEFTLRVVSQGRVIHTERVVVGKTDTQTPIFSDEMEQVIFHPFWGVPDGIKSNEIQPALSKGQYGVLAKHNLRIQSGGRDIDPASVDWKSADLRRFHVYQPPGGDNVLGVVKFRFPNKHDVYMHDTPTKGLFSNAVRAYSHGCMRVQNPVRLAEIVLAEDKKMASDRVRSLAAAGAPANNQINLTHRIPVHVTYFTATVEDDGKSRYFADLYGHENRINLALEGKAHLIAKVQEPKGPVRAEPVATLFEASQKSSSRDWMRNVFTNN